MGYTKKYLNDAVENGGAFYTRIEKYINSGTLHDFDEYCNIMEPITTESIIDTLMYMKGSEKKQRNMYYTALSKSKFDMIDRFNQYITTTADKIADSDYKPRTIKTKLLALGKLTKNIKDIQNDIVLGHIRFATDIEQLELIKEAPSKVDMDNEEIRLAYDLLYRDDENYGVYVCEFFWKICGQYITEGKEYDCFAKFYEEVIIKEHNFPENTLKNSVMLTLLNITADDILAYLRKYERYEIVNRVEETEIQPVNYFNAVKDTKTDLADISKLSKAAENCKHLIEKYTKLGQTKAIKKLEFLQKIYDNELKLAESGITSYVMKDSVTQYIEKIARNVVKIQDIEEYERDIPDDIADKILAVKELFDKIYIVFTDYTGAVEKQVAKERRDRDPIVFGTIIDPDGVAIDKMYYIGDWEDEFCDLTLEKMVEEFKASGTEDVVSEITLNEHMEDPEKLRSLVSKTQMNDDGSIIYPHEVMNE